MDTVAFLVLLIHDHFSFLVSPLAVQCRQQAGRQARQQSQPASQLLVLSCAQTAHQSFVILNWYS